MTGSGSWPAAPGPEYGPPRAGQPSGGYPAPHVQPGTPHPASGHLPVPYYAQQPAQWQPTYQQPAQWQPAQWQPAQQQPVYAAYAQLPPQDKSVGAAVVLTFLFGPLGLLYASVPGGLVLIGLNIVLVMVATAANIALGAAVFLLATTIVWILSMIIAAVTATQKHQRFEMWRTQMMMGGYGRPYGY